MTRTRETACSALPVNDPVLEEIALQCEQAFLKWIHPPGKRIVSVGGADCLSVRMARMFPECTIVHVDANAGLSGAAAGLANLHILSTDFRAANFLPESASTIVMVDALSSAPDPAEALRTIAGWLEPGGHIFACDTGRRTSLLGRIVARRRKTFHDTAELRRPFEQAMLIVEESFPVNRGLGHATLCSKPLR